MNKTTFAVAGLILGAAFTSWAKDLPPASDRKGVTFAADIKPIFENACTHCHGPEKAKARLRLDSLAAVLKGGEEGKVVVPGNSAKSSLVLSVAHVGDPDSFMPKGSKGKKVEPLTPAEIGLIRAWIDQGAK